jgi:hypothetical protein
VTTSAQPKLQLSERQLWDGLCRTDLTAWTVRALSPRKQKPALHHQVLLRHLELVGTGAIDRLLILMPPGYAKSTYASVLFPAWFFAQRPYLDVIGASHVAKLAEEFSGKIQDQIRAHWRMLGYRLSNENVESWRTSNGGRYRAAGVGGSITGRRSDLTVIDDPIKGAADAESQTVRDTLWNWYTAEVYTRQKPGSRIVVIETWWNEDDLAGRLLAAQAAGEGDRWVVLRMPAICDSVDDPLGRKIGQALWPAWHDEIALLGGKRPDGTLVAGIRKNVGEYVWGALYQQNPRPRGAAFFDEACLLVDSTSGLVDHEGKPIKVPVPMPTRCDTVFGIIDTAIKSGAEHNSTAVTWFSYDSFLRPTSTLILDWDIVQIEGADQAGWLPSTFERGEELARQCGARRGFLGVLIEDKATGTVLLQQAENARRDGKYFPAFPIDSATTAMGKDERAIAAQPYVIADGVKITDEAYYKTKVHKGRAANHFISQVTSFRLGAKKSDGLDLLDTFCYGVTLAHGSSSGDRKGI